MPKGSALHRLDCNFGQFRKKYYVSELNRLPLVKVSTDDLKVLRQMLKMGFRDTRASARLARQWVGMRKGGKAAPCVHDQSVQYREGGKVTGS